MQAEIVKANIKGGYFSTDLINGQTRKYHAILTYSNDEFERKVVVATVREAISINAAGEFDFSGNYFGGDSDPGHASPGRVSPGHASPGFQPGIKKFLKDSSYLPYPSQVFQFGRTKVVKRIEVSETEAIVKLSYVVDSPESYTLQIDPLYTYRNFHGLNSEIEFADVKVEYQKHKQRLRLTPETSLLVKSDMDFVATRRRSIGHYYPVEAERGYEAHEDLHSIGVYQVAGLPGREKYEIVFKLQAKPAIRKFFRSPIPTNISDNNSVLTDISRFTEIHDSIPEDLGQYLVLNARQFIVKSDKRYSLLAGYHWFNEWSRDTFISFKGILLGLGRFHEAQKILLDWSKYISVGLLPNTMEGLHYNSLDGILWYFQALWHYWEVTKDKDTVLHILPKLERVVYAFVRGSKYGIEVDKNGYLIWTDETKALTWMDAVVDGRPIIQRAGAAVEIQALWYNALQIVEKLALLTNYKLVNLSIIDELEKLLETNFEKDFWIEDRNYYADTIYLDGNKSYELRPNQLAAFALTFRLGNVENGHKMLETVKEHLLTPVGLHTLAPGDHKFAAEYKGSQYERDCIYHQGTIWPWLLLLYYSATLKLNHNSAEAKDIVRSHITEFWKIVKGLHLIHTPEMFNPADHMPAGAVAQSWSTAALIEGVMMLSEN